MTCRCATPAEHDARARANAAQHKAYIAESAQKELAELKASLESDVTSFTVHDFEEVNPGTFLVIKVEYEHAKKARPGCTFEGIKILVFKNVTVKAAFKWREIDPHFQSSKGGSSPTVAPPPIARFPGDDEGWKHALLFAKAAGRPNQRS